MATVAQLGYAGAEVSDLDAWERLAVEVLGLELGERGADGILFLRMDENHHRLALHPGQADDVAYLGWQVRDAEALDAVAAQVHAFGITVSAGGDELARERRVRELITFPDPSGIRTEVYYGAEVWVDRPLHSRRPTSGFVTGDQGFGHSVIRVDDAETSLRFYCDAFGMRVSDYIGEMTFLHCNTRHHSLALMSGEGTKRLWHWMLQVNSLDDVGTAYDLCEQLDVPLGSRLGRHTNDRMVSFYIETPSGFEIEYGWGGRTVDDATWQVQRHAHGRIWGHERVRPVSAALASAAAAEA
jgi:2,3-dihydroxybiphenyl 1,2-dioxygenase